jgi:hypothetical protein
MAPYISAKRKGTHIINLARTACTCVKSEPVKQLVHWFTGSTAVTVDLSEQI